MQEICTKCNKPVEKWHPRHVVGVLVWHRSCWDSYSNWLQAHIEADPTNKMPPQSAA
jgi:hypothetical protein